MSNIVQRLAQELASQPEQVSAAIQLLDGGASVPFIARYRKEATGGLDDTRLRTLEERLGYLRELEERRQVILESIRQQGKLDPALEAAIREAHSKTLLEDLYLPYRPRRRSKAQMAREAGLEPLALGLLEDPHQNPETLAADYLDASKGIDSPRAALDGARQILMEHFAEDAVLSAELREYLWRHALLASSAVEDKRQAGIKYSDYFDAAEAIARIPSHRVLALLRGRAEGVLQLRLILHENDERLPLNASLACEDRLRARFGLRREGGRPADAWLADSARWAWRVKLATRLESELMLRLRENAETEAIRVFARNLKDLLMAAPAGPRPTLGLDPGYRTGVKAAVVDATGKLLDTTTLYPHAPQRQWKQALQTLAALARKHRVELVSIGNGTASRETERLVAELIQRHPELRLTPVMVSEAGASVYSASALAAEEFPSLDVSLRGAVSIARRLQDPLAELVKIEPKAIGVGQYQHDVDQRQLGHSLAAVVEDCVNAVGVDVNTASAALLSHISGLNQTLAHNIVAHRDRHGAFTDRRQLKQVARLGPRAFEQAAGFLRINGGDNPLDASAVHPEAYGVVRRIMRRTGKSIAQLMGDSTTLRKLRPADFTDEHFGEPTVRDILRELEKPGRDPRPRFQSARFKEGVETLADLTPGMLLEGVVTNVTNFGAFVDIGVHQDGLVHISALADRFVKDPHNVVKAGEVVKVKVMAVDSERKRISLSMRLDDDPRQQTQQPGATRPRKPARRRQQRPEGSLAAAFAKARGVT